MHRTWKSFVRKYWRITSPPVEKHESHGWRTWIIWLTQWKFSTPTNLSFETPQDRFAVFVPCFESFYDASGLVVSANNEQMNPGRCEQNHMLWGSVAVLRNSRKDEYWSFEALGEVKKGWPITKMICYIALILLVCQTLDGPLKASLKTTLDDETTSFNVFWEIRFGSSCLDGPSFAKVKESMAEMREMLVAPTPTSYSWLLLWIHGIARKLVI